MYLSKPCHYRIWHINYNSDLSCAAARMLDTSVNSSHTRHKRPSLSFFASSSYYFFFWLCTQTKGQWRDLFPRHQRRVEPRRSFLSPLTGQEGLCRHGGLRKAHGAVRVRFAGRPRKALRVQDSHQCAAVRGKSFIDLLFWFINPM